eukprot:s1727_g5.t1
MAATKFCLSDLEERLVQTMAADDDGDDDDEDDEEDEDEDADDDGCGGVGDGSWGHADHHDAVAGEEKMVPVKWSLMAIVIMTIAWMMLMTTTTTVVAFVMLAAVMLTRMTGTLAMLWV